MFSKKRGLKGKPAKKATASQNDNSSQFMEALKLYEAKQYKKSNKLLENHLKKKVTPDSLALKALNLYFIGEKAEAAAIIKQAISKIEGTNASPICCHVLGIYMRQVKDYPESCKWFQASLDNGSVNNQIYRDLATLYSQIGDFKKALDARKHYWQSFMGYRANWTALAVAQDINGSRQEAINTLTQFENLAKGKISEPERYEHSECLMYKNDILYKAAKEDKEKLKAVLKNLEEIENDVFDKYSLLERKASIFMKLGQLRDASLVYRTLIKRNPDNFKYYRLLEVSLGVTDNEKLRQALYEKLETFYPRSEPPKYIPLTFIKDEAQLSKKLESYILRQLKRGLPATFKNMKPLYKRRADVIPRLSEAIVTKYLENLDPKKDPIQYIWTCYYLSEHFLHVMKYERAMEYINLAIEHTPTLVEFYILKGRILKHMGQLKEAASVVEEGRNLDLQDRFINCRTVKYFLRANMMDKAVEVASLFTRIDEGAVNGVRDLHLVEASWFIVEQAEAYYRLYIEAQRRYNQLKNEASSGAAEEETFQHTLKEAEWEVTKNKGLALKRFMAIQKFYRQFVDDQLDFHSYCMRKGTPRAYLEMLEWGKALYTKPMYVRAMRGASKIYFEIYDGAKKRKSGEEEQEVEKPPKGGKKNKSKKEASSLNKRKEEGKIKVMAYPMGEDRDVYGEKLVATRNPLEEFGKNFYNDYNDTAREYQRDFALDFSYRYRTGQLALCMGAITRECKRHGNKTPLALAMAIVVALATTDDVPFDDVAKKVAIKGLEKEFALLPLNKRTDKDFDWLNYFLENSPSKNTLNALLFLRELNIFDDTHLNKIIAEKATAYDSFVRALLQNQHV